MAEPKIVERKPVVVTLDPGSYWWCSCGESKNQPYCDGSHAGTGFTPVQIDVVETEKVAFCLCKHTGSKPRCDGSHTKL